MGPKLEIRRDLAPRPPVPLARVAKAGPVAIAPDALKLAPMAPAPSVDPAPARPPLWKRAIKPLLNLVMGSEWSDYLTRRPLPENAGDQGPGWVKAVASRLDGVRNEGVAASLNGNLAVPLPLPGLTAGARGAGEAQLRRTPEGHLELALTREIDPKAAAGMRFGLGFGFSVGGFRLQEILGANADVEGQLVHRATMLYDVDPKDPQAMAQLAGFLKGHGLLETFKVSHAEDPGVRDELIHLLETPLCAPAKEPGAIPSDDRFSREHLRQLGLYEGVLGRGDLWIGDNLAGGERPGLWGWAKGLGLDFGTQDAGHVAGLAQNVVGTLVNLATDAASTNADFQKSLEKGHEQLITFDHGKPVQATEAVSTSQMDNHGFGVMGFSRWHWEGSGKRYAASYDPSGKLLGLDYSEKTAVDGKHQLSSGMNPADPQVKDVLDAAKVGDTVVLTYSLRGDALNKIAELPADQQAKAVEAAFKDPGQFGLTRTITAHNNRFEVGGDIVVGMGLTGGVGIDARLDHQYAQIQTNGQGPQDPLPNGRPW